MPDACGRQGGHPQQDHRTGVGRPGVSENNLDVFMRYLRSKVDRPGLPRLVHTERGVGYTIREGTE